MPQSFALLTDRRNLALAVNTADFPGTEVRMWYNPDQMENRQRAVFMAGCDYLLPELVSMAAGGIAASLTEPVGQSGGSIEVKISGYSLVESVSARPVEADGSDAGESVALTAEAGVYSGTVAGSSVAGIRLKVNCRNGETIEITPR